MDKQLLVNALISNKSNRYTSADKDKLMAMSETEIASDLQNHTVVPAPTVEQAQEVITGAGMTINSADFDKDAHASFVANKDEFESFMAEKTTKRGELVDKIVNSSAMLKDDVEAMSDSAMENLANSLTPGQNYSAQGQDLHNNDRQEVDAVVDYS
jgi:hypothetical protein